MTKNGQSYSCKVFLSSQGFNYYQLLLIITSLFDCLHFGSTNNIINEGFCKEMVRIISRRSRFGVMGTREEILCVNILRTFPNLSPSRLRLPIRTALVYMTHAAGVHRPVCWCTWL